MAESLVTDTSPVAERADCCIVGGGPAGAFLGLLLARAGVRVLLLEERRDLARQFRGETVAPPTLALLEDLGLLDRVLAHARSRGEHWPVYAPGAPPVPIDGLAPGTRHPYLTNVPQEALLGILHAATATAPGSGCCTRRHGGCRLRQTRCVTLPRPGVEGAS